MSNRGITLYAGAILVSRLSEEETRGSVKVLVLRNPFGKLIVSRSRGGGVLPSNRLIGMCRWMVLHFNQSY